MCQINGYDLFYLKEKDCSQDTSSIKDFTVSEILLSYFQGLPILLGFVLALKTSKAFPLYHLEGMLHPASLFVSL
jgi:hypothetical protein